MWEGFFSCSHQENMIFHITLALWWDIVPASRNVCRRGNILGQNHKPQTERYGCILTLPSPCLFILFFCVPFFLVLFMSKNILLPSSGAASFTDLRAVSLLQVWNTSSGSHIVSVWTHGGWLMCGENVFLFPFRLNTLQKSLLRVFHPLDSDLWNRNADADTGIRR